MINMKYQCSSLLVGIFLLFDLSACTDNRAAIYQEAEPPDIGRWAHPNADYVALFSDEPNECLADKPPAEQVLGRLAFRSPFLLGGQAARRGLTCQACHGQGAVNEGFFVVGLSETPGTADVTSFHFSDVLGDESFNPVPIPSLSDDIEGVDFDPNSPELDAFVTRLITKEFTGPVPSPQVKASLLSYLRGLRSQPCDMPRLKQADLLAYKIRVIDQSFEALTSQDLPQDTLSFMTAALRIELGRLHDRFPNDPKLQAELVAISSAMRGAVGLAPMQDDWAGLKDRLLQAYDRSLFNPDIIRDWDAARRL